ncbi:cytochrome b-245 light chain-like [Sycon ciliatum]|uniref:cytochrome b-245 light chain-like n=1 Tax=Sycon ciliatum TaxID=27933 RepID=UPI0031F714CA
MRIEFAMWANLQAMGAAMIILVGGILGSAIQFRRQWIAWYSIPISLLIMLIEYPRSKRSKGSNFPRVGQEQIAPIIHALGPVGRNYFLRFVLYLCMCIPMLFLLPTMLGGICLFFACTTYMVAALLGEQWRPIQLGWGKGSDVAVQAKRVATSEAPSHAPPRAPSFKRAKYSASSTDGLVEAQQSGGAAASSAAPQEIN